VKKWSRWRRANEIFLFYSAWNSDFGRSLVRRWRDCGGGCQLGLLKLLILFIFRSKKIDLDSSWGVGGRTCGANTRLAAFMTRPPLGNGRMLPYDSVIFWFKDILQDITWLLSPLGHCEEVREETRLGWGWQSGCQDWAMDKFCIDFVSNLKYIAINRYWRQNARF